MRGFTLLELLFTLIITTILLTAAVPTFHNFITRNRTGTVVNKIVAALQYARTTAIAEGENIKYCSSKDGYVCGGDWMDGQLVVVAATNKVLRAYPPLTKEVSLSWRGSFGRSDYLLFTALGTATNGRFIYKSGHDINSESVIIVSGTGRVRTEKA